MKIKNKLPLVAAVALLATHSNAAVVATIDTGGDVDITTELGTFSSTAMQSLITTTADLTIAGVLDAEGTFSAGDFSDDTGALSDKLSGTTRYGRTPATGNKTASGTRFGFINGAETWTPTTGLSHFGLITYANGTGNPTLKVTVTYSDLTTESLTSADIETSWMGFHKSGQTITSIGLEKAITSASFATYDDVSLAFVPEPSAALLGGLGLLTLLRRRR